MATETAHLSSAAASRTGPGADNGSDWSRVTAALATCNDHRLSAAREIRRLELALRSIACAVTVVAVVMTLLFSTLFATVHFAVIALVLGLFSLRSIQIHTDGRRRTVQGETCRTLLPLLLDQIDDLVIEFGVAPEFMSRMPGHYFMPRRQARYDLAVTGQWRGAAFSVCHCTFTQPTGEDADQVTFSGVIACMALGREFPGDFAALRRPEKPRSFLRQTMLPDRLAVIRNDASDRRSAYEFVSTEPDVAESRLNRMLHAVDALGIAQQLDAAAQIGIRNGEGFLLLPSSNSPLALPDVSVAIDVDSDLKPFRECLWSILRAAQTVREI